MDNYPNNSNAYRMQSTLNQPAGDNPQKEEKEVVTPVGTTPATPKKKTVKDKAASLFIKEDLKSVCRYVFRDILVPALKKTFVAMINNGTNMMVYGDGKGYADDRDRNYRGSRSSYQDYYDRDRDYDYRGRTQRMVAPTYSYDEVIFPSRGEAEEARRRMRDHINRKGVVSVAYMYALAGWSYDYTAEYYGWRNLDYAEIVPLSSGYYLKLPKAIEI